MVINLQLYVETYQKRSAEDNSYHPEGGSAVTLVRLWASWFSLFSLLIAFFFCLCTKQKVTKETYVRIHAWIRMGLWYSRTVCLKQIRKCERDSVKMYTICLRHQLRQHTIHSIAVQKGKLASSTCEIFASSSKHLLCFCLAHSEAPFLFTIHHSPDWWCLPGKPSSCPQSLKWL